MGLPGYLDVARIDDLGRLDSPVHRLDPRAKCLTTAVFLVVTMSFPRTEIAALMPLVAYPWLVAAWAGLPLGYVLRRGWVALPFAAAVGIFNPWFDTVPWLRLGPVVVSRGWVSFASILLRCWLTVSAALVLVASTGLHPLASGLARLGVPRPLVMQMLFMVRYFYIIADEAGRMLRSVEVRSVGPVRLGWRAYVPLLGHLLLRSLDRSQRLYRAMLSRGFDGDLRLGSTARFKLGDTAYVAGWTLYLVAVRQWPVAEWIGTRIQRGLA